MGHRKTHKLYLLLLPRCLQLFRRQLLVPGVCAANKTSKGMYCLVRHHLQSCRPRRMIAFPFSADATSYRAISARSNYLSSDRVDIAYAGKELCRDFSIRNQKSHEKLKRLGNIIQNKKVFWVFLFVMIFYKTSINRK